MLKLLVARRCLHLPTLVITCSSFYDFFPISNPQPNFFSYTKVSAGLF